MAAFQLTYFPELTARQRNIILSPKINGTAYVDSLPYLEELGINLVDYRQPIQFLPNTNEAIHRWSPYVQGFSAKFVQRILDMYKQDYKNSPVVLDPFAGSGTVLVQSKLNNIEVYGVELNPLLHFVTQTKINTWGVRPGTLISIAQGLSQVKISHAPEFLKSSNQFNSQVLNNLEIIKSGVDNFIPVNELDWQIKNLLLLAFSAILIDCSNLKRSPCLGYCRKKIVSEETPFKLFNLKIKEMVNDLEYIQRNYPKPSKSDVFLENSMNFIHPRSYDLIITSPPYMNGLDYVINYKIEMGWLGFADNHKQLKKVKDEMVVCDNVSKGLIRNFADQDRRYTNNWLENIKEHIYQNIERRGNYRRKDMPEIVHKYFDDMYKVMKLVGQALNPGGRFILVVGDSLIADVYLPTDLLLARIGKELGLSIEKIEVARNRRSGQVRSYKLRETIITLRKE
ncbi:MAG: DNA methyltransferase [Chloroflexota bacterium]